jgi:hypothetical protein
MKEDNRIVVDLSKCQWARFYYQNQHGDKRNAKPAGPTVFNDAVDVYWNFPGDAPHESRTMLEVAKERNLLDIWTPCVVLKLTANETLKYRGEKAVSIYNAWCERIFNKGKK